VTYYWVSYSAWTVYQGDLLLG